MSAEALVTTKVTLTGIGDEIQVKTTVVDGTTFTKLLKVYPVLAVADTPQALEIGDISTIAGVYIKALDYDAEIDLDFVSSFDADLTVKAGEPAAYIPNPAGIIYFTGVEADETPKLEVVIFGT